MIITRTALRLSFLGGGTDYPIHYEKHEGICVGSAVSLYTYLSVRRLPPYHDHTTRVCYRDIECVKSNEEIKHAAVRECILASGVEGGLEIFHQSDLPAGSGTGSSSSFVVGLLNALYCLEGKFFPPSLLTKRAIQVERHGMKSVVGSQDQAFASHGGLNVLRFRRSGEVDVTPLALPQEHETELNDHLLLFFLREQRVSSDVAATYVDKLADREVDMFALMRLAELSVAAIQSRNYRELGVLMDRSWRLKASLSPAVQTQKSAAFYSAARVYGSYGGKITGAGGGGSLLLVCPPDKKENVIGKLEEMGAVHVPFTLNAPGSSVIFAS